MIYSAFWKNLATTAIDASHAYLAVTINPHIHESGATLVGLI